MTTIVLIVHNVRSTHNVGSLLRTADGLGIAKVYFTGYTPYPLAKADQRLPHIAQKVSRQIAKTALGAEQSDHWQHEPDIFKLIGDLQSKGFQVAAIEQSPGSTALPSFRPPERLALIVGREVEGIEAEVLQRCEIVLEIPMFGIKESFNVVQAAAMVLYHCRFYDAISSPKQ